MSRNLPPFLAFSLNSRWEVGDHEPPPAPLFPPFLPSLGFWVTRWMAAAALLLLLLLLLVLLLPLALYLLPLGGVQK